MSNCKEFGRVSIFATCVVNHLFPNVAFSVARVLERCSVAVDVEETQAFIDKAKEALANGYKIIYTSWW